MPSPISRLTRTYERSYKRNPSLTLAITNGCLKCLGDLLAQLIPAFASGKPFIWDTHRSLRFLIFGCLHGPCVGKWHEFLEHRIPLTVSRGGGNVAAYNPADAEQDLQLVETEKSLTTHRPITIRSRSTAADQVAGLRMSNPSEPSLVSPGYSSSKRNRTRRFWGLSKRLFLDQLVMAPLYTFMFISITAWFEGLTIPEIKDRLDHLYWYILTANWKIWPLIQVINFNFMPLQYRVPWQGSCGVLWTVFLSLSTYSSAHFNPSNASDSARQSTAIVSTISSLFFKTNSSAPKSAQNNLNQLNLTTSSSAPESGSQTPNSTVVISASRNRKIP